MADNSISIGDNSVRVVGTELDTDPQGGLISRVIYEGSQEALEAQGSSLLLAGIHCHTFHHVGPVYRMWARFGNPTDGASEVPVDIWERVTELALVDIRNSQALIELAVTADTLNVWVKDIKDAIRNGTGLSGTVSDEQQALFDYMSRGAEFDEETRVVLRRRRTISPRYAAQSQADVTPVVYRTAALVATWVVPLLEASRLPRDPQYTPSNTVWGWKERADNSTHERHLGRVQEVKEWVFAAWSTLTHDVIGSPPDK